MSDVETRGDKWVASAKTDALIAHHVEGLKSVGWYKRESCHGGGWIPCAEGDVTEDQPQFKASLMHWRMGWDNRTLDSMGPRAIPRYTSDRGEAMRLVEILMNQGHVVTVKADGLRISNPNNPNFTVLISGLEGRTDYHELPLCIGAAALNLKGIKPGEEIQ